ncbi:patatin-like phospholipase family protein [Aeribacillus composti]|uniref:patatin-like phospholipase family protein n=1 Tax=Aeribacillus composti TaxID=1868734 RepID=UPI003D1A67ED
MKIDGVFSGGGIKGFAFIGAYKALEEKGFEFARVAGTSAGSIIAALIAAGYKSDEILFLMDSLDLRKFLDKRKGIMSFMLMKWISVYWRMGLYKGQFLEEWMEEKLKAKGVSTFADLPKGKLRVIASDLTNGKIVVLPDDLSKYGINPNRFSVAKAVRMSSCLPYFFEPVKLWTKDGVSIVVDGGVLSNFPIWLFDGKIKKRPILGFQLSAHIEERPKNEIKNALSMFHALFETMKEAHDARHIATRHERSIVFIPVENILTTEFKITNEKKQELIQLGKEKTETFLKKWSY